MGPNLNVAEELFLLCLVEKKNAIQVVSSAGLPYILAGAVLVDLLLGGSVRVEDGRLAPEPDSATDLTDLLAASALEKIRESGKPRKIEHWVSAFGARRARITGAVILALEAKHILCRDNKLFQWAPADPEAAPEEFPRKYLVKRQVRDSLFSKEGVAARPAALLGLLDCAGLTDHLFTRDELIRARKKIKTLRKGEAGPGVDAEQIFAVIDAVEVAIAAAVSGE